MSARPPDPPDVLAALAALGYTQRWLDLGILSPDDLIAQFAELRTGVDPNPEHYRYRTLREFLSTTGSLTDELIDGIAELLRIDPDPVMAASVRGHFLVSHPGLSDKQFERLATLPETQAQNPREAWRARLLRQLAAGGWSPELVELCLAHGDRTVHHALLGHPQLDRTALLAPSTRGINKAIRNHAAHLLHSRRFRPV